LKNSKDPDLDLRKINANFHIIPCAGQDNILKDDVAHGFYEIACRIPNLQLIIFDSLSRFFNGQENDNIAATRFVEILERIGKKLEASVMILHHFGKGAESTGKYKKELSVDTIRGASGFSSAFRAAVGMVKATAKEAGLPDIADGYVRFAHLKHNTTAKAEDAFFSRSPDGLLTFAIASDTKASTALQGKVIERIKAETAAGREHTLTKFRTDFYSEFGLARDAFGKELEKMVTAGIIMKVSKKLPGAKKSVDVLTVA